MSLILTRKGNDTGEELYPHIDTRIDGIMSEELKAKKIALTDSEKEQIMKKCPIEKIENDVDKINFTLGLCYWEILDLVDICGYLLSTNQNLVNTLSLEEIKNDEVLSEGKTNCLHDLEKELEMINDTLRFINELFEQVMGEIRENKESNKEN